MPGEGPARVVTGLQALVEGGERFGTIYADPPWAYANRATRGAADGHYRTLGVEELAALPVALLAAPDAHLHLWATSSFLFEAQEIVRAWGFTYKSMFVWNKTQLGLGNYWRVSHEVLQTGARGSCPFRDRSLRSWGEFRRGRHSAKPEEVRLMIERASPGPRLELFGRRAVPGWTVMGDQVERDLFSA
jgi:N6-adenosine-specific RNA methylase IME4